MLEGETSGAPADLAQPSQPCGAVPGGPFPHGTRPTELASNPSIVFHSYTLQFLVAAIKRTPK
jgi:hypothetical protein